MLLFLLRAHKCTPAYWDHAEFVKWQSLWGDFSPRWTSAAADSLWDQSGGESHGMAEIQPNHHCYSAFVNEESAKQRWKIEETVFSIETLVM